MIVAGLISGTSVDGIDVAVCDIDDHRLALIASATVPYPPEVRAAILCRLERHGPTGEISRLNFLLGELFADCPATNLAAGLDRADRLARPDHLPSPRFHICRSAKRR